MRVKGAVLLARGAFVRSQHGEDAWKSVIESTSAQARETLGGSILSASWYPFAVNAELDEAIVRVVGGGDRSIFKQIGASSARENLGGAHRSFLAPDNPQAFLARTGSIYRFYYDHGRREYQATGPTSGVMTTYEAETYSETDCLTVIGWYEQALGMCGARDVEIDEVTCRANGGPHCRYQLCWQ